MAKRKQIKEDEIMEDAPSGKDKKKNEDSDSDEDMDMVNVDFEWFDPQPAVDFHGLKTLLRQLFDVDHQLFDLSSLADLILSQPLLGSTVKVDGNESDPYAFLTVLNMETHKANPAISQLRTYLTEKAAAFPSLTQHLKPLLSESSDAQIGLILSERFINMPHETIPPMYEMLLEEINWALEEKEPYNFTHYLVLSKCYTEIESQLPSADQPPSKKKKKDAAKEGDTFWFHPEDPVLHQHALAWGNYEYTTEADEGASDAKRAFQEMGIKPKGHLTLIAASQFGDAVKAVEDMTGKI